MQSENATIPIDTTAALLPQQLAEVHCSRCHIYPSPDELGKQTWKDRVLPQMGYRFGIYENTRRDSLLEGGIARRLIDQSGTFPANPTITEETWQKIKQFYIASAPEFLRDGEPLAVLPKLEGFDVVLPAFKINHPVITQIKFNINRDRFYAAHIRKDHTALDILDRRFKVVTTLGLPHPISDLTFRSDTLMILMMGSLTPSDAPTGTLIRVANGEGKGYEGYSLVLKNLRRPVDVAYDDLDRDGNEDIVICEYGNHAGGVTLFRNTGKHRYTRKELFDQPGAIEIKVQDMNGDSLNDLVVLMAQGDEGIDIYYNKGDLQFARERVLRFSPLFGSVALELTDFNKDGYFDIVYTNGDNADYSPVLKPYHGIRLFINDGTNHFKEQYSFPLHGAYKTVVRDFDADGDMDLATISFFPDFFNHPERGFIYLENVSGSNDIQFRSSTFTGSEKGRWITLEAADIDKDGDEDLMLGSFTGMNITNDTSNVRINKMIKESPPFIVLRNKTY